MIEFEVTLNCNYKCDYCHNGRNDVLDTPIPEVNDTNKLLSFLNNNDDIYLYGGEPLLAKNINLIVDKLKNKRYVIQTNFSIYKKIDELIKIDTNIKFQISIHRTQIKNIEEHIKYINTKIKNIKQIDVMFVDENDLKLYRYLQKTLSIDKHLLRLIPVADFATKNRKYLKSLKLYNKLRKLNIKDIVFDDGLRSIAWEEQFEGLINLKGKKCVCYNKYIQYDPQLNKHHCPQRYDGLICPFETCFNYDIPTRRF